MVVAAIVQTIPEVGIRPDFFGCPFTSAQDLDVEIVVVRRGDIGQLLVGVVPFGHPRKSSFSTYQRLAASSSGVRIATWWPCISANGELVFFAGRTKSAIIFPLGCRRLDAVRSGSFVSRSPCVIAGWP